MAGSASSDSAMPRTPLMLVLVVAGFAGALVGAVFFGVASAVYGIAAGKATEALVVLLLAPIFGMNYGVWLGAPFALLLVTPVHISLVRISATSWFWYAAAGPVVGGLAACLFFSGVALLWRLLSRRHS